MPITDTFKDEDKQFYETAHAAEQAVQQEGFLTQHGRYAITAVHPQTGRTVLTMGFVRGRGYFWMTP